MQETVVRYKPEDVEARLAELGIPADLPREAALKGQAARNSCTDNNPANAPGIYDWSESIRGVRDGLIPLGWTRSNEGNFPSAVSPDGRIAISVTSGDKGTGRPGSPLKSKNPKGPMTQERVQKNRDQLELQGILTSLKPKPGVYLPNGAISTWLLVKFQTEDELRYELSLPASIGADSRVSTWAERLIFASIPTSAEPDVSRVDFSPEVDIAVIRKKE